METKPSKQKKNNYPGLEKYAQYSGIAFQMMVIIFLSVWGGKKIDEKYFQGKNIFVIIFSILGVGIAIYLALKDFINLSRKK